MTPAGLARLKLDEGCVLYVYDDVSGKPISLGSGGGVPTIGYGRNLRDSGISQAEADLLFANDVTECETDLLTDYPWMATWLTPPTVTGDVVTMVQYNTGAARLFVDMLEAIHAKNEVAAAVALLDSDAARRLNDRYERMAAALVRGSW